MKTPHRDDVKKLLMCSLALIGLSAASPLSAQDRAPMKKIVVKLTEVEARPGSLLCGLYGASVGFPTDPRKALEIKRADKTNTCTFEVERDGYYAVTALHDENNNGKNDTNMFGLPKEGWATSNNVKPALRAPNFDESKFRVKEAVTTLKLKLRY